MKQARARRAVVVVGSGPAGERGWLGLRAALALGAAGCDVTVWLAGAAVAFAGGLDAGAWLGGDPRIDLDGLVDDLDAVVLVDPQAAAAQPPRRPEFAVGEPAELARRAATADVLLAF